MSTLKGFMITINIYRLRNVCNGGGAQMGGGGTAEKNGDRNAKTPSPKCPPNAAILSAADRHGLSVRSFEREGRDFTRQQRFPMEGAIFWGIRFDGRTRKIGESIRRGDGRGAGAAVSAIRHGSVILMPFSRSTRPARWFFPSSRLLLPSFFLVSTSH